MMPKIIVLCVRKTPVTAEFSGNLISLRISNFRLNLPSDPSSYVVWTLPKPIRLSISPRHAVVIATAADVLDR